MNRLWACHWFAAWLRHLLSPAPPAGLKRRPDDGSSSGLDLILASAWDIWSLSAYITWTSEAPNDRTREICWDSTLLITGVTPSLCWFNYSCRSQLLPCVVCTPSTTHQHREKLSNAFLTQFSSLVWVVVPAEWLQVMRGPDCSCSNTWAFPSCARDCIVISMSRGCSTQLFTRQQANKNQLQPLMDVCCHTEFIHPSIITCYCGIRLSKLFQSCVGAQSTT